MKTTFKLITIAGAVLFSSSVFATTGCAGAGAEASISSGGFIVNPFTMKCSANVFMNFDATQSSNTVVSVCAASAKGNRKFGGSSDGGAVKEQGTTSGTITQTTPAVGAGGCT